MKLDSMDIVAIALGCILSFALGLATGRSTTTGSWQESAIDAGVAEWVIDAKTGERTFEWLECEDE